MKSKKKSLTGLLLLLILLVVLIFLAMRTFSSGNKKKQVESSVKETSFSKQESADDIVSESKSAEESSKEGSTTKSEEVKDFPKDDWKLVLVNKKNPLNSELTFEKISLTKGKTIVVDSRIKESLESFIEAGTNAGYEYQYVSGYRSLDDQINIYNNSVNQYLSSGLSEKEAKELTESVINPPGSSEHMTGLAVDVAGSDALAAHPSLEADMDKYPSQQWLIKNAPKYGFILRYPDTEQAKKETLINYESWHFRYVGVEVATYITDKGITLEQYLEELGS